MAIRTIFNTSDPVLHKVCKPVTEVNDRIRQLIDDLTETMHKAYGVGLAAPQVGVLRRVCVVQCDEEHLYELVNPEIIWTEGEQTDAEGCLSAPGLCGDVTRPMKVRVKALDRNGDEILVEGEGLLARAFCHEIDHLDGIVYLDKATNIRESEFEGEE